VPVSSTGERLIAGRYRLRRRLGQGAMGTVWEAFDEFLRRPVAVKEVLLPPGMPDEQAAELRERTLREARAIAALSHTNVITLHDVAVEDGEPFVVMEYMLAHSLATVIDVLGPLPEAKVAAIADAVAAGLGAAHQVGITHRDVKPGNVLIGVDGRVKLTDFGIARNVAERTLTSTGIMLGSPAYIAPEVAAGREVTPAADVWGLGATLFAVIEGRPPYDVHGAVLETLNQVVNGDVPRPSGEGPLDEVVAALMTKEPAERISLREVRNRLHGLLPAPNTPLLTDEELAKVNAVVAGVAGTEEEADAPADDEPTDVESGQNGAEPLAADPGPLPGAPLAADPGPLPGSIPLSADPGPLPDALSADLGSLSEAQPEVPRPPVLSPAPGQLPFMETVRAPVQRERGAIATGLVAFLAVLFFFAAIGGGFALARYLGGQPLLPPDQTVDTSTTTTSTDDEQDQLEPRNGNAATVTGVQGGEFTVPVPRSWVEFVEEVKSGELGTSTRVYYLEPNGTQVLTIERLPGFYQDYTIEDYISVLESQEPDVAVKIVFRGATEGLQTNGVAPPEEAVDLHYRATTSAKAVVPDDPSAQDQTRSTFAHLLPYAGDLWVVSLTVPIEQEDTGNRLFEQIVGGFVPRG
jgi:eukaryotic-like serine/threonine-protein kinase